MTVLSNRQWALLRDTLADARVADSHAKHGVPEKPRLLDRVLRGECDRFIDHLAPIIESMLADAFDAGMLAFSEGRGSDANPYREWTR